MCCDLLDLCFGRRDARPVCRDVSLVVAMTLLAVVFDGWLWEVDLLCSYPSWVVYFVIPVCWPDTRTSVYESRGWYFSRCTAG